jgi:hypothetical protein
MRTLFRALAAMAGASAIALALASTAAAAETTTSTRSAPPYSVTVVAPDPATVEATTTFQVTLAPAAGASLAAGTRPDFGVDATPGRAQVVPGAAPGAYTVTTSFPVRGSWYLVLTVSGPAGQAGTEVNVAVGAPGAIPTWLGWLIGLVPLAGLALFLLSQVRRAASLSGASAAVES